MLSEKSIESPVKSAHTALEVGWCMPEKPEIHAYIAAHLMSEWKVASL
jgi:hypothetical protein